MFRPYRMNVIGFEKKFLDFIVLLLASTVVLQSIHNSAKQYTHLYLYIVTAYNLPLNKVAQIEYFFKVRVITPIKYLLLPIIILLFSLLLCSVILLRLLWKKKVFVQKTW